MTDKELLYVEDASNHLKHLTSLCQECSTQVKDQRLKEFLNMLSDETTSSFNSLLTVLKRYGG